MVNVQMNPTLRDQSLTMRNKWLCNTWLCNMDFVFPSHRLCRSFHPHNNSQRPPTSKDFHPMPVFLFLILSDTQGNYRYHFYNVFGMMRSVSGYWTRYLPHSKPVLYHWAIEADMFIKYWDMYYKLWEAMLS